VTDKTELSGERTVGKQELQERWADAWPALVDRTPEPGAPELDFILGDEGFTITLLESAAPKTCAAFLDSLPVEGHIIHAAWSGDVIRRLEAFDLPFDEPENATYFCAPGDVCFTSGFRELTMVYGDSYMSMPSGRVYESVFGIIRDRMRQFQRTGQSARLLGAMPFRINAR
jgi:hypothetical protein